jgi:hypothetical protein
MAVFTTERRAAITAAYLTGESQKDLAPRFGTSQARLSHKLREWGVATRRRGPERTYDLDEKFFDQINNEAKAYWLGFILADGCVRQTGVGNWILEIGLQSKDCGHLHQFAAAIEYDGPVKPSSDNKHRIDLCSKQLCRDLIALGCVPDKTHAGFRCPKIRATLLHHLYRGYFDGDGCLTYARNQFSPRTGRRLKTNWQFSVVGHPRFIRDYQGWLIRQLDLPKTKIHYEPMMARILYCGNIQVGQICQLLYNSASVYLPRKRNCAERVWAVGEFVAA